MNLQHSTRQCRWFWKKYVSCWFDDNNRLVTRWWLQICLFMFNPTWGRLPKLTSITFFRWMGFETTTAQNLPEATDLHSPALVWKSKILPPCLMRRKIGASWFHSVSGFQKRCKGENNSWLHQITTSDPENVSFFTQDVVVCVLRAF